MNHVGIGVGREGRGGGGGAGGRWRGGGEGGWGGGRLYSHESWNSFHGQSFTLLQHSSGGVAGEGSSLGADWGASQLTQQPGGLYNVVKKGPVRSGSSVALHKGGNKKPPEKKGIHPTLLR